MESNSNSEKIRIIQPARDFDGHNILLAGFLLTEKSPIIDTALKTGVLRRIFVNSLYSNKFDNYLKVINTVS